MILGYHNVLRDAGVTVTASTEAAGFEKENAYDWRTGDYWKPTAVSAWLKASGTSIACDYFAVYGHDMAAAGSTIVLQYSDNDSTWTSAFTAVTPTDGRPIMKTFTQSSHNYWRVLLTGAVASLGVVSFGRRLDMEYGLTFGNIAPELGPQYMPVDNLSDDGEFIGRTLVKRWQSAEFQFNQTFSRAWMQANWPAFRNHAERYPFFALPYPSLYPDAAIIAYAENMRAPTYESLFMGASIPVMYKAA